MKLETLKRKIDEIAVRRMLRDSKDHFERPREPDTKWAWKFCRLCGDFYNHKIKPWCEQGATKSFCSSGCEKTSAEIAAAIKQQQNAGKSRRAKLAKLVDANQIRRLRVLARWFGKGKFSYVDAARALRLAQSNAEGHIRQMISLGWLEKHKKDGAWSRVFFSLTDCDECIKALAWAKTKEAKRCDQE